MSYIIFKIASFQPKLQSNLVLFMSSQQDQEQEQHQTLKKQKTYPISSPSHLESRAFLQCHKIQNYGKQCCTLVWTLHLINTIKAPIYTSITLTYVLSFTCILAISFCKPLFDWFSTILQPHLPGLIIIHQLEDHFFLLHCQLMFNQLTIKKSSLSSTYQNKIIDFSTGLESQHCSKLLKLMIIFIVWEGRLQNDDCRMAVSYN